MKKKIGTKFVIFVILALGVAIGMFAEVGVATAFNMTFKGLSYVEYVKQFYAVPWHLVAGIIITSFMMIFTTEIVYKAYVGKEH